MKILTTAPASARFEPGTYLGAVSKLAHWSEAAGIEGMLIYTDNSLIDPWCVAQAILRTTSRILPLVAVQPAYMSPYTAARKVSSLAFLYGRKIALNMVAGSFKRDLQTLGDSADHDSRYDRLVEYTQILQALLCGETVTFNGHYYTVSQLKLLPALPPGLMPDIYLSGGSEACIAAATTLDAIRLSYTKPPNVLESEPSRLGTGRLGLRCGVIARARSEEAWAVARARFPADRRGQLVHKMARGSTDSVWHYEISELAEDLHDARDGAYWLYPIKNYRTFCPYLVGSYDEVASYIARYEALGYGWLILDVPESEADLDHAVKVIRRGACLDAPEMQVA